MTNATRKTLSIGAALACLALGASQAGAMGGSRHGHGGVLSPSASPYALLAPVTLENTPGGEGRAAFQGRPSLCPPGSYEAGGAGGTRCVPER
jgi:hypothetical protein